jgi:hypothetical protein
MLPLVEQTSTACTQALEVEQEEEEQPLLAGARLAAANKEVIEHVLHPEEPEEVENPLVAEAQVLLRAESEKYPAGVMLGLTGLFVWLVISDFLKDLALCGSLLFWLLVLSIVPMVLVMMLIVRRALIHKGFVKRQVRSAHPRSPAQLLAHRCCSSTCNPLRSPAHCCVLRPRLAAHAQADTVMSVSRWASCRRRATLCGRLRPQCSTRSSARWQVSLQACLAWAAASSRAPSCCTLACCQKWLRRRLPP